MAKVTHLFYYDEHEKMYDGFYPTIVPKINTINSVELHISFRLINYGNKLSWIQQDKSVIYGFTESTGSQVLELLNRKGNVDGLQILNSGCRIIYPITRNSTFYILRSLVKKHGTI